MEKVNNQRQVLPPQFRAAAGRKATIRQRQTTIATDWKSASVSLDKSPILQ
ncbi:MAG: hypothetical protein IAE79_27655 [Anaerolinea sp.]|nr:hypothetical protein [Anaerolinea sp.]